MMVGRSPASVLTGQLCPPFFSTSSSVIVPLRPTKSGLTVMRMVLLVAEPK